MTEKRPAEPKRRMSGGGIALCLFTGAVVLPYLFFLFVRLFLFGGYLSVPMIKGTYLFSKGDIREEIQIKKDSVYIQKLEIGKDVYTAEGRVKFGAGGGAFMLEGLYRRVSGDGKPLRPPEKEKWVYFHWDRPGKMKFSNIDSPEELFLERTKEDNIRAWSRMCIPFIELFPSHRRAPRFP